MTAPQPFDTSEVAFIREAAACTEFAEVRALLARCEAVPPGPPPAEEAAEAFLTAFRAKAARLREFAEADNGEMAALSPTEQADPAVLQRLFARLRGRLRVLADLLREAAAFPFARELTREMREVVAGPNFRAGEEVVAMARAVVGSPAVGRA